MGFRNELGFCFAFAGTRDIFGDENDHHFEPIGVNQLVPGGGARGVG
jgi:hypothetical protein